MRTESKKRTTIHRLARPSVLFLVVALLAPGAGLAAKGGKPGGGGGGGGGDPPAAPVITFSDCYYKGGRNRCDLWVMNADGSNDTRILKEAARGLQFEIIATPRPTWAPDVHPHGRIAYNAALDGRYGIWVVDEDGSDPVLIAEPDPGPMGDFLTPAWAPAPAPDGKEWIAYAADGVGGNDDIYVVSPDGSEVLNLTQTPQAEREPAWSPDATELAILSAGRVWTLTLGTDATNTLIVLSRDDQPTGAGSAARATRSRSTPRPTAAATVRSGSSTARHRATRTS
jgi:Tol biopolymer transport system component